MNFIWPKIGTFNGYFFRISLKLSALVAPTVPSVVKQTESKIFCWGHLDLGCIFWKCYCYWVPLASAQVIWSGDYNGVARILVTANQPEIWSGVRLCVFMAEERENQTYFYIFPINEYLYPDLCLETNSLKVFLTRTLNELKYNRIHPGAAFRNFETQKMLTWRCAEDLNSCHDLKVQTARGMGPRTKGQRIVDIKKYFLGFLSIG